MRKSNSTAIDIAVTAYPRRDGRFEVHHAGRVLCTSREPFCEAARRLLAEGFPPGAVLGLRHIGQHDIALRGRLARAAELTVTMTGLACHVFAAGRHRAVMWRPRPCVFQRRG